MSIETYFSTYQQSCSALQRAIDALHDANKHFISEERRLQQLIKCASEQYTAFVQNATNQLMRDAGCVNVQYMEHDTCARVNVQIDVEGIPANDHAAFIVKCFREACETLKNVTVPLTLMDFKIMIEDNCIDAHAYVAAPRPKSTYNYFFASRHNMDHEHAILFDRVKVHDDNTNIIAIIRRALLNARHPSHHALLDITYYAFKSTSPEMHTAWSSLFGIDGSRDRDEVPNSAWLDTHSQFETLPWYSAFHSWFRAQENARQPIIRMMYDHVDWYRNTDSPTIRYCDTAQNWYSIWLSDAVYTYIEEVTQ